MFEKLPIPFDSWQVQNGAVIDAPNCSGPSTLEQVGDLTENPSRFNLANVVFPPSEIGTGHPALALGEEVERCGFATLGNNNVLRQLLKRLTHRSYELQFALQDRVILHWFHQ